MQHLECVGVAHLLQGAGRLVPVTEDDDPDPTQVVRCPVGELGHERLVVEVSREVDVVGMFLRRMRSPSGEQQVGPLTAKREATA
ncbi:hypothetical protein ACH5A2_38895 [Streptomyces collinus]|uniref:hypothetical protein n=1 Tax=Streptomyces collinus TaxID=42684 RepID=UPI0037B4951B